MAEIKAQDQLEDLARRIQHLEDGLWALGDDDTVRRHIAALNRQVDAINTRLAPAERFERLDPDRLVRIWRKMYRARR